MSGFLRDLRYGVRSLARSRGYTVVAVLTLALGISVNTTIFSFTKPFLFPPVPFDDPDRVIFCWSSNPARGWNKNFASMPEFATWRADVRSFSEMSAMSVAGYTLLVAGAPVRVTVQHVTANHLSLINMQPQRGRTFLPDEEGPGAPPVAIVSHGLAERRFGGADAAMHQKLVLDGAPYTVVGVASKNFWFPSITDVWVPLQADLASGSRNRRQLLVLGRLAPGASIEQARAEMKTMAAGLERQFPDSNSGWTLRLVPTTEEILNDNSAVMLALLSLAVGFVLLIACINVSNLTLARAQVRTREIAVRAALGATRAGIVRQLLAESLVLAAVGGSLGLLLGYLGLEVLIKMNVDQAPLLQLFGLDASAAIFTAAVSLLSVTFFGLLPAFGAARMDVATAFKDTTGASAGTGQRFSRSLVIAEIALALPLLLLAGLSIRAMISMRGMDRGFDIEHILIARVDLPRDTYAHPAQVTAFYDALLERGGTIPRAAAVSVASALPAFSGRGTDSSAVTVEGRSPATPDERPWIGYEIVSARHLETMAIPLLRGRIFGTGDVAGAPAVGIVNAAAARRYWPEGEPIGRRLKLGTPDSSAPWITVIGVAGDMLQSRSTPASPLLYLPLTQHPTREMWLFARATGDPTSLVPGIRAAVERINGTLQLHDVQTLERYLAFRRGPTELYIGVLTVFGIAALLLTIVGVYGVIAYAVSQRTREIGVRMALGANRRDILLMVVGQGLRFAATGFAIGIGAAFLLGRALSSRVEGIGISGTDPLTFGAVGSILTVFALVACFIPAFRATRVDPVRALRYE